MFYFTFKIKLKTAQNLDTQCIYDNIAYVQKPEFTPALKLYKSSARNAHEILHVCGKHVTGVSLIGRHRGAQGLFT